jgi:hypothetical protein
MAAHNMVALRRLVALSLVISGMLRHVLSST